MKDIIDGIFREHFERYLTLTPEQKKEADIRRAHSIIHSIAFGTDVSPKLLATYREWLIENLERKHVEEAIMRLFDESCDQE